MITFFHDFMTDPAVFIDSIGILAGLALVVWGVKSSMTSGRE